MGTPGSHIPKKAAQLQKDPNLSENRRKKRILFQLPDTPFRTKATLRVDATRHEVRTKPIFSVTFLFLFSLYFLVTPHTSLSSPFSTRANGILWGGSRSVDTCEHCTGFADHNLHISSSVRYLGIASGMSSTNTGSFSLLKVSKLFNTSRLVKPFNFLHGSV